MQYFLDLEQVAPEFAEQHGLVPLDQATFESMVHNDPKLQVRRFETNEPHMSHIVVQRPEAKQMTSMDKVHAAGREFFTALAEWDGEELQSQIIAELIAEHCSLQSRVQLASQALMYGTSDLTEGPANFTPKGKMLAIEMAETIGPDWAQVLYHFAKLVTKLA